MALLSLLQLKVESNGENDDFCWAILFISSTRTRLGSNVPPASQIRSAQLTSGLLGFNSIHLSAQISSALCGLKSDPTGTYIPFARSHS